MEPGQVYRDPHGNLYLVLPGGREAYIGNENPAHTSRALTGILRIPLGAKVVGRLTSLPWGPALCPERGCGGTMVPEGTAWVCLACGTVRG